jgi:hypothetical protein
LYELLFNIYSNRTKRLAKLQSFPSHRSIEAGGLGLDLGLKLDEE